MMRNNDNNMHERLLPSTLAFKMKFWAWKIFGALLIIIALAGWAVLATWSADDPSLNSATVEPARNLFGYWGAVSADILFQFLGLASPVLFLPLAVWGWYLLTPKLPGKPFMRVALWPVSVGCIAGALAGYAKPGGWPLPNGLGGVIGDYIMRIIRDFAAWANIEQTWADMVASPILPAAALLTLLAASALKLADFKILWRRSDKGASNRKDTGAHAASPGQIPRNEPVLPDIFPVSAGDVHHGGVPVATHRPENPLRMSTPYPAHYTPGHHQSPQPPKLRPIPTSSAAMPLKHADTPAVINMPDSAPVSQPVQPRYKPPVEEARQQMSPQSPARPQPDVPANANANASAANLQQTTPPPAKQAKAKPRKKLIREEQLPLLTLPGVYSLPPLDFLRSSPVGTGTSPLGAEAMQRRSAELSQVLKDFGVDGEIISVKPGPVVTLFELEPARGVKSSRVINLADDIARSMSAVSARIAVIPGRNVIGIELPNDNRQIVFLRDVLESPGMINATGVLNLALGTSIGGDAIVADLAKMPHLLIAGTTGSGKSVGVNTMILSLLYRMTPEQCKFIMIDPKMLELSIYDGIPHLLAPVVTDPKKAVAALKWTVREMEERYKKMSKVGVRNISGYNERVAQAKSRGESIIRTVQTGFDDQTGEAIYEKERLDYDAIPYIVVVIDEMADLMMVAGKEIEGLVQRVAQMARAAGIHVITATQRPSVDVITGTIKANFPTRISFQVTSKVDSRTILGEQGAEHLLGAGDMLFMRGGGRIGRVHGPFVRDEEIEKVVQFLKTQATPKYIEEITVDVEEEVAKAAEGENKDADIYQRAVEVVLRDQRVSTSYIQRRLSIGYNRAATIIERMEEEGLVGAANNAGKREILMTHNPFADNPDMQPEHGDDATIH
jgi:S-DNA-T family DNA segregation ATPase FtsK/SpoIIIE